MAKLISVGIHENVNISKETGINQDGKRVIVMEIRPDKKAVRKAMMRGEVLETMKSSFLQFDPNFEVYGKEGVLRTSFDMLQDLNKETLRFATYYSILLGGDWDKAVEAINPEVVYKRLGIVTDEAIDNAMDRMNDKDFMTSCLNKAYEIFHDLISAIPNVEEIKLRHKFIRGSKKKTFSSIPKFNKDNVFVEPMTVPREETKLAWTVYELEKGLNSAEEVAADTSEQSPDAAAVFEAPIAAPIQPDLVGVSTIIDPTLIGSDEAAEQSPYVVEDTTTDMEAPMTAPQVTFDAPTPK